MLEKVVLQEELDPLGGKQRGCSSQAMGGLWKATGISRLRVGQTHKAFWFKAAMEAATPRHIKMNKQMDK